ncbi:Bax inhibitor-1/YccA family protein [Pseudobacteriovorax antillogorgiicola]|uniref:Modulator of FtsH protease n=1 Tax=Pseudobacteriovorax antillogorgiicola TaxID=1513793 RepID=A0A1Y6C2V4_9BACT|nr:Bax inhibitor-1 family protein [Pseudobacteriovorax antillogorgiicola]TCS52282.1 hypothetical protein EDD56_10926 [Pseudobacteriovorax antillogorgiicola]SMF30679.1 hypothetical protein SAMN06296036_109187 [Pseudobacteriovorax antillogorgiicola]
MHYQSTPVAASHANTRDSFIRKTYFHVFLAILMFTGIEAFLFKTGIADQIMAFMTGMNWLIILGAFMVSSWIATRFAQGSRSKASQYFGLSLYVFFEAIIFVPLLYIAEYKTGGGAIESAATATLLGFAGLTAIAFATRADFSWLGKFLMFAGVGALILIVCSVLFGLSLGVYFTVGMILFAGAAILYDTSNIIHHYSEDDYVAAALQLFASVALLFWYVLRFFNSRD